MVLPAPQPPILARGRQGLHQPAAHPAVGLPSSGCRPVERCDSRGGRHHCERGRPVPGKQKEWLSLGWAE